MGRRRQISDEDIEEINSLYDKGMSGYKVSKATGWSLTTVMSYIGEPKGRGRYPKLTIAQSQELNRLYNSGFTQEELKEKFSLSQSQVGRYVWNPRKKWAGIKAARKKTALESSQTNCSMSL